MMNPVVTFHWKAEEDRPVEFVSENVVQFGYSADALISGKILYSDIVHPEDLDRISSAIYKNCEEQLTNYVQVYRILTGSGDVRWVEEKSLIRRDQDGTITQYKGIIFDITEYKITEDELHKSKAKNRAMLDVMPDFLFQIRKDGTFLNYSVPNDGDLFLPPSVFLGRNICEVMPKEIAKQTMHYMEQALQTKKIQTFQYPLPVKDNIRDFEARLISSGEDEVLAIATDITERKKIENALKESEKKFRTIFENSPLGIFHFDQDGVITHCNKKLVEIYGVSEEEILGFDLLTFYADPKMKGSIKSIISGSSKQYDGEFLTITSGKVSLTKVYLSPIMSQDGSFLGGIGIVEDISHRAEAEKLSKRKLELEKTLSSLSSMFVNPENLDHSIDFALQRIGEVSGCSRSFVFRFNSDASMMSCTHEWCNMDVESHKNVHQNFPFLMYPWMSANLRGKKMLYLKDVSSLPPSAFAEKRLFETLDVSSLIGFPIYVNGSIAGFMGMSNVKGREKWQEDSIYILRMVSSMLGMSIGVKEALHALKESEGKYSSLVEKSEDGIVIIQAGLFKFSNQKASEFFGCNRDDLVGTSFLQYVSLDYRKRLEHICNGTSKGNAWMTKKYEFDMVSRYGVSIPVEMNASMVEYDGVPAVMGIIRDFTERRDFEERLSRTNEYLDQLVGSSPVAILSLDSSQNVVMANKSALELLGYDLDDMKGIHISKLIFDEDMLEFSDKKDFELDFIHRTGARVTMNVSTSSMNDGLVVTLQEMSGLRGLFIPPLKEEPVECLEGPEDVPQLESGRIYIIDNEDLEMGYSVFSDLVRSGNSGLCLTRQNPQRLRDVYSLSRTPIVWLTNNQVNGQPSIGPTELFKLHPTITNFIDEVDNGIVLLDGLEYLILENDFRAVMKFIEQTNDAIMASNSTLIIQVDPNVFDPREYHLLKRWMKVLPQENIST